ncbi:LamG-like jellyroll fold domain-containing protein [Olleya sp. YS]|uniref:LamG-like jellyroll fold domain-containing protein n=1 Tax=Olleya sp. YS TaxID=3028318 RepID=UPI002434467E|nr:LamG-like jellyroll fold domain-containing protein [Olleya sp. YS]WGD34158.1 choice-of-anchor D domain-containing protein [Olleya sp. YS]
MKTFTLKALIANLLHKKTLVILMFFTVTISIAQTSAVQVSVNWPNWSSENRVEIYNPSGTLLATIDNGYNGASNNSYATTLDLSCIPDGNNYYAVLYDTYNDGWNGAASNITITSSGSTVLTNSGNSASSTGVTLYFNVSGGCSGTCSSTVSSFPYNEGFESGLGAWTQDTTDNFDWTRNSNGTPSNNTGPSTANGGNWYIFTEASSNYNNTSNLVSPCFDLTGATSAVFSFYYHMYGADMGTLNVDLSTNNGLTFPINLWSQVGQVQTNNGSIWSLVTLDLSAYLGQTINIRFSGTTGGYYRSDMAIDDISLTAATTAQPEINITGNGTTIISGDATPNVSDDTDFGSINVSSGNNTNTFTIHNAGTLPLNLTGSSPYVTITGANASDFTLSSSPSTPILAGNNTTFNITFDPSSNGLRSAIVTIANDDSNENPYTFYIQGYGITPLTEGPGGVTANLETWLKANDGAGISDNQPLTTWYDQAKTNHATVNMAGQEPTYRDNPNYNVNFNPVIDFDSSYNLAPVDGDFSYDDTNGDFLQGSSGFYTQDMFAVILPDTNINTSFGNMDIFCGDEDITTDTEDVSGFGYGRYSARFTNEVYAYCVGPTTNSAPYTGYGVADNNTTTSYDNVGILNARNNTSLTQQELFYNANNVETVQNDVADFSNVNNSRYWIGRSEGYEASMNARVVEVISFSSRKNDANLTDERNKIQSYLAIKYGITLGVNGISQDYVASDGTVIWDTSANAGYNYDIAGIGRDDNSDLIQKQSKSVNNSSIVAMSLTNTELTNNLNSSTFNTSNEFLVWGNDGQNTNTSGVSITVNLGPATITTVTDVMNRKWKIVETAGDDVGKVEVSVFETDLAGLPPLTGNDVYVMLVADDAGFTTNLQTVFLDPSTFNGLATREGTYDFDGTKYFTFGVAHEEVRSRHLGFDGIDNFTLIGDKVDLAGDFTASAWVKPDGSNALASDKIIVAKNNGVEGYKFFLTDNNVVSFSIGNLATDRIDSNTTLPNNVWHHVAVIYHSNVARLYIDGVLDTSKTIVNPTPNGAEFAIGAIYIDKLNVQDYFKGDIDEIRIWDEALTLPQLRYVMNQELEKAGAVVNGAIVPNTITKNEINTVGWTNLKAYYNMNSYIGTHLNDVSGNGNRGSLTDPDKFTLEYQSSPLPYNSTNNGSWDNNNSWENGSELYIPGSPSIVDSDTTIDWNIVKTNHDITLENSALPSVNNQNRTVLGLFVESNQITANGDTASNTGNGLTITHYLKLDGKIDLEGESQLIQTQDSELDITSAGTLERDQQGTQDLYTYNYWSSPVGVSNTTSNNNSYTLPSVYKDGTNSAAPVNINFLTSGYDGTSGTPIGIADYWIWKYANQSGAYSDWQHVRSTGSLSAGEGFTMKGVANTNGNVTLEQNYVLEGKPNNGEITLPITAGNEYLVGNPYASAIDAHQFIMDNAPTIEGAGSTTGTLYFWEHWGGGSHNLADYQGGYATYNLSGATPAASYGTNDPMVATGGTPSKLPGRYIPVAQGFFVKSENTGTVKFSNSQRVFEKEGSASVFVRQSAENTTAQNYNSDDRLKIRLGLNSVNGIHRQLLVTQDQNAKSGYDWGYDGELTESQIDDMYWIIDNNNYIIQGTDVIDVNTVLPIGLKTDTAGNNTITIDALENVPADLDIYVHDILNGTYHDLRQTDYVVNLGAGEHLNRFEIVFDTPEALSIEDDVLESDINIYYSNSLQSIVVNNPKLNNIKSVNLYSILGQHITNFSEVDTQDYIELNTGKLSTGSYIITLLTNEGEISKKVLVE